MQFHLHNVEFLTPETLLPRQTWTPIRIAGIAFTALEVFVEADGRAVASLSDCEVSGVAEEVVIVFLGAFVLD